MEIDSYAGATSASEEVGSGSGWCSDSKGSAGTGVAGDAFRRGAAFFFTAFFAAFLTVRVCFVLALALALVDLAAFFATFFFAVFFFATVRFAFATGRFFALLFFFAMIQCSPRGLTATRCESSLEKVRCHLCSMLESLSWIAYARGVPPTENIRPLRHVWLRPRRVFRELASQPIAATDYLLGAAQGIVGWLALSRAQNAGAVSGIAEIFGKALSIGSIAGVASLFLMGAIYSRLGARRAGGALRNQVIHVLAYGSVPVAASLAFWVFTAVLVGAATFEQVPHPDVEGFVALFLHAQFFSYLLLQFWGVVIQVMGLSEIRGVTARRAFGLWVLGQIIGFLALLFLMVLIATLFPNAVTG